MINPFVNGLRLVNINTAAKPLPEDGLDEITKELDIDLK